MQPSIHFRPLLPAVATDGATTLELLITISAPPAPAAARRRPPLNLALVIDRSGSMAGSRLSHARKAARALVQELTPRDRLAIVCFDDAIQLLMPSQPVDDPIPFLRAINRIKAGGSTDLFAGWRAGAGQVAEQINPAGLNRVLLLSDGQANSGLTDGAAIAAEVQRLTERGISTSAFGLGEGFDEDLMGAIAAAGDGTLAQIESPQQLTDLYASELQGLAATAGRKVSLGLRCSGSAELLELINDLAISSAGNHQLPNLRYGQQLQVGLRLQLPAWKPNQPILSARLAWDSPTQSQRQKQITTLTLPVLPAAELLQLEPDAAVAEQLALLQATRRRQEVIAQLDQGDLIAASANLAQMDAHLAAMPQSSEICRERQLLREKQHLLQHDCNLSRKRLRRESLRSSLQVWDGEASANDER